MIKTLGKWLAVATLAFAVLYGTGRLLMPRYYPMSNQAIGGGTKFIAILDTRTGDVWIGGPGEFIKYAEMK